MEIGSAKQHRFTWDPLCLIEPFTDLHTPFYKHAYTWSPRKEKASEKIKTLFLVFIQENET